MERIFTGERGIAHALIAALGTEAVVRRGLGVGAGNAGTGPEKEGTGNAPGAWEERTRFVCTGSTGREGAARVTGGVVSTREPTMLRRREERLEGLLSPIGLSEAPRAGLDRLVVFGREYRIDEVGALRAGPSVAAYRLACSRS